ncbi:MAG: hypothetical protein D6723_15200 [Acidobacteria bacterium]|nr:MAG: hypothetical protein D6723_15200 [Acidobacteriota bacterium]
MLIDARHRPWIIVTGLVAIVATGVYIPYHVLSPNGPSGGSWPGLIYGILGSGLMVYAGLLSLRKKVPTWRIGRAETWMRGHIWLGLLSLLFILFHSGFRFGGALTTVLMVFTLLIILSGVLGLALQQFLPRMMMVRVPAETIYEQIDHVIDELCRECDILVEQICGPLGGGDDTLVDATPVTARIKSEGRVKGRVRTSRSRRRSTEPLRGSEPLKAMYLSDIRPFLERGPYGGTKLGTPQRAAALFEHLRTVLPEEAREIVDDLQAACEERRQLSLQKRLHHWLHGWLFIHVPLSMAVLVLALVHAVMALRY